MNRGVVDDVDFTLFRGRGIEPLSPPGLKKELLGGGGGGGGAGVGFFLGGGFTASDGLLSASGLLTASVPSCCLKKELTGLRGNGAGPAFFGGIGD